MPSAPNKMAPPMPTTTPMTVLRVLAGMPEVAPSLSEFKPGVGVDLAVLEAAGVLVDVTTLVKVDLEVGSCCSEVGCSVGCGVCDVGCCEVGTGVLDEGACVDEEEGVEVGAGVDEGVGVDVGAAVLELDGGAVEEGVGVELGGDEAGVVTLPVAEPLLSLPVALAAASAWRARLKFCIRAASTTQSAATMSSRKRGEYMAGDDKSEHTVR